MPRTKITLEKAKELYRADQHPYHAGLLLQAALAAKTRGDIDEQAFVAVVMQATLHLLNLGHASKPFEPKRYRRTY